MILALSVVATILDILLSFLEKHIWLFKIYFSFFMNFDSNSFLNILKMLGYNFLCLGFFSFVHSLFLLAQASVSTYTKKKLWFLHFDFSFPAIWSCWETTNHMTDLYTCSGQIIYIVFWRNIQIGKTAYHFEKQDISTVCYTTKQTEK